MNSTYTEVNKCVKCGKEIKNNKYGECEDCYKEYLIERLGKEHLKDINKIIKDTQK